MLVNFGLRGFGGRVVEGACLWLASCRIVEFCWCCSMINWSLGWVESGKVSFISEW
jgi:hypothetical protein